MNQRATEGTEGAGMDRDCLTTDGWAMSGEGVPQRPRAGVLTISDACSRGEREDASGTALRELLTSVAEVVEYRVIPDERAQIEAALRELSAAGLALVLTTGGTGLGPRDVTPEATLAVVERVVPGLAEAMRQESLKKTPFAMLSRGVAGIIGRTLIINMPGSPKAVRECFAVIAPVLAHAVHVLAGGGHGD
jgi:molybdopterin adenylyltransferase